jgi:hypothetical protein
MDTERSPGTNPDALQSFADGVIEKAEPDGRHAIVLAPYPHEDTPEGMERPVNDGGDWRPLSEVKAEAETLVLITPPEFDRDTWTAPEVPGAVPPEPDFAE